ncbi:MAG: AsmA family protein [Betaproteobacteria bacterium]
MRSLWLRRLALGLLGVVLLLAALAGWFVATFDADRYKGLAVEWMKREHDRTLAIDGPLELSLFPRLQVRLSKVRLSEQGRPDEFASVDEAALAVQLLPLLARQLVVDRVSARGVRVVYARDARGRRNVDDLLGGGAKTHDKANDTTSAPPPAALKFDISRIDLDDVRASLRDAAVPLEGEVTLVSLHSGRLGVGAAAPLALEATVALTQPALVGRLSGQLRLAVDPAANALSADEMQLQFKGDVPGARALDATLRGSVHYAATSGTLQARDLALDFGARLGALALTGSRLRLASFAYTSASETLALTKLQLELAGRQGADPLSFALDWPQLDVQRDRLQGSALQGRFALAGANAVEGRFASKAPAGRFEQIRLPGLEVTLKGRNGPRQFDGQARGELLLDAARRSAAFERMALNARVQEPGLAPLALQVDGRAEASAQSAAWKLAGNLNENKFTSDGKAEFGSGPKSVPTVQAEARFDSLDVNKLLPAAAAASAPAGGKASDTPVDLAGLKAVNGKFALRAGRLAVRQYRVADARLDASLADGVLRVPTLQGKAWGGSIDASGSADAATQRMAIRLAGNGVDVNALLKDVAGFDRLEGTGRVAADLNSAGRSVTELRRTLAGSASLQLRDGAVKGINLARALRQAKAALALKQDAVQRASQTEKTDFSELSASFRIAGGVAHNSDLDLKSPFLRLGGQGDIDVGRGRIDYTARATVVGSPKGQDAGELAALKGLTVPVRLSGPFEAVDWHIEWSAVAAGALRNELQKRLDETLQKKLGVPPAGGAASAPPPRRPEDILKDRLKGLLR